MEQVLLNLLSPKMVLPFLLLFIFIWIITIKELYSSFWYVLQYILNVLLFIWRVWSATKSKKAQVPSNEPSFVSKNVEEKLLQGPEMAVQKPGVNKNTINTTLTQKTYTRKIANDENVAPEVLTMDEVITVMTNLGTSYDVAGDKLQGRLCSNDIADLFEEHEPSLQEVQEAFATFDENNDGFIDAKELRKVLCQLCFAEPTERDCKRMISAYDTNRDGRIDFDEFLRLVTDSFSQT